MRELAVAEVPHELRGATRALRLCVLLPLLPSARRTSTTMEARLGEKLHGLSATALSGRTVDFSTYAGKPLLMVNVASC